MVPDRLILGPMALLGVNMCDSRQIFRQTAHVCLNGELTDSGASQLDVVGIYSMVMPCMPTSLKGTSAARVTGSSDIRRRKAAAAVTTVLHVLQYSHQFLWLVTCMDPAHWIPLMFPESRKAI